MDWEIVPKGTPRSRCRSPECGKDIYWIERPRKNKPGTARVPVDCDVPGGEFPDSFSAGKGVSHFKTCVAANEF